MACLRATAGRTQHVLLHELTGQPWGRCAVPGQLPCGDNLFRDIVQNHVRQMAQAEQCRTLVRRTVDQWLADCSFRTSDTPLVPNRPMQRSARLLGWVLLAALIFLTLCPIGVRPISGEPVWLERSAAYAAVALAFSIGYPRQRLLVLALTVAAAGALEAAQMLQPSRHGRLPDFYVKAAGCAVGWAMAYVASGLEHAWRRRYVA